MEGMIKGSIILYFICVAKLLYNLLLSEIRLVLWDFCWTCFNCLLVSCTSLTIFFQKQLCDNLKEGAFLLSGTYINISTSGLEVYIPFAEIWNEYFLIFNFESYIIIVKKTTRIWFNWVGTASVRSPIFIYCPWEVSRIKQRNQTKIVVQ